MAHTLQERYSSLVLAKLRKELVLKDGVVFNNDYEGDPKAGAVKIPQRDTEVSVAAYDKANGVSATEGATSYVSLTINKDYAVNEIIDGYDAAAVPDNLVADRLDSAGYSMAKQIDNDGGTELLASGTAVNVGLISKDTVYDIFVDQRTALSKANIPNSGRFALCTPDTIAALVKSNQFTSASSLGDEVKQAGIIGRIAGFNVIEWNDDTAGLAAVCGHPRFATRVNEWQVPVGLQSLAGSGKYIGASAVQGRHVYAHKVLRAAAVRCLYAPGTVKLSAAKGATAGTTILTAVASGAGETEYTYKKNPATRAVYDVAKATYAGTALTSGTTEIACAAGDIIEVVGFKTSKAVSVGYIIVSASEIK